MPPRYHRKAVHLRKINLLDWLSPAFYELEYAELPTLDRDKLCDDQEIERLRAVILAQNDEIARLNALANLWGKMRGIVVQAADELFELRVTDDDGMACGYRPAHSLRRARAVLAEIRAVHPDLMRSGADGEH